MRRITCRACDRSGLQPILDLGCTPLANRLLQESEVGEPELRFPLQLVFCPHCTLVQITETVSPEILFRDYVYFSSFSDTMLAHAEKLAESLIEQRRLTADSLVVEAASNDGYLLKHYAQRGVPVLGIEPARNIAAVANASGIRTECDFFGVETARRLVAGRTAALRCIRSNRRLRPIKARAAISLDARHGGTRPART